MLEVPAVVDVEEVYAEVAGHLHTFHHRFPDMRVVE